MQPLRKVPPLEALFRSFVSPHLAGPTTSRSSSSGKVELLNRLLEGKAGAFQAAPALVFLAGQNLFVEEPPIPWACRIVATVERATRCPRFRAHGVDVLAHVSGRPGAADVFQGTLDPTVAPRRIVTRHRTVSWRISRSTPGRLTRRRSAVHTRAMSCRCQTQDGVRCDQRRHLTQDLSSEAVAVDGEPTLLSIGQPQAPAVNVLFEDPFLSYPAGSMTYDLRRLRLHGLIARVPHSHCYRITPGRRPGRHLLCSALRPSPPTRPAHCSRRDRPAPSPHSIALMPPSPISCRRSNWPPEKLDSITHTSSGQDS